VVKCILLVTRKENQAERTIAATMPTIQSPWREEIWT